MDCRIAIVFLVASSASLSLAQTGGQGGQSGSGPTVIAPPASFFVSGKVRMDDGTPLPDTVQIQSICRGQKHTEGHTDSRGNFSFEIGRQAAVGEDISNGAGASRPGQSASDINALPSMSGQVLSSHDFRDCQVQAFLPGFTSQTADVVKHGEWGNVDVGTIQLHRTAQAAVLVSVTTAAAPDGARKAFEKGREEEKKRNWDAAHKQFEKATSDYPKFAEAWLELGRVQEQQRDIAGAQASFTHASEADPQLAAPYHEQAGLAFDQQKWKDVLEMSGHVLKLSPAGFPDDWYYTSVANYSLHNFDEAETSSREGLKVDTLHRFPRMEYLLGVVLAQKGNYSEAMEHMKNYLRLDAHAEDAATVTQQIAGLEKAAGAQPVAK